MRIVNRTEMKNVAGGDGEVTTITTTTTPATGAGTSTGTGTGTGTVTGSGTSTTGGNRMREERRIPDFPQCTAPVRPPSGNRRGD